MNLPQAATGTPVDLSPELADGTPTVSDFEKASCAEPHFGEAVYRRLASPFDDTRADLARDPECPVDLMNMLWKDSTAVQQALARNPRLPLRYQRRLAREGGSVGLALLENPSLAVEVFQAAPRPL